MTVKKVYKSQKKSTNNPSTMKASITSTSTSTTPSRSYKDLITDALIELKGGRKGTSRIALKKFVKESNPNLSSNSNFDHFFNLAIKKGVTDGIFEQPKGPSGTIKLVKKPASSDTSSSKKKKSTTSSSFSSSSSSSSSSSPSSSTPKSTKKVSKKTTTKTTIVKAPKKITKKTSTSSTSSSSSYKTMVIKGVISLNNGKGSSRVALKKFVKDLYIKNSGGKEPPSNFDYNFNKTIKKAIDDGYLSQPKGPSGLVKILKKGKTFVSAA
ncbi:histone H1 PWA37_001068 [Arxiozyma heterogenica]